VKEQSDIKDVHAAAGVRAAETSAIQPLVAKYKISTDDVQVSVAISETERHFYGMMVLFFSFHRSCWPGSTLSISLNDVLMSSTDTTVLDFAELLVVACCVKACLTIHNYVASTGLEDQWMSLCI
jgi:hypothetical protein